MTRKKRPRLAARKLRKPNQSKSTYSVLEPKNLLASVGWDGPGQGNAELSYYIGNAPTSISQSEFESTIEEALQVWANVIDVEFIRTDQPNQQDSLDFTSRPIDGTNGTLAQAYFPSDVNRGTIAGDVQFDSLDSWEIGNSEGYRATDLMYVAVHEIGHALGLDHDHDDNGAVLSPTVSSNQTFEGLSQSDIDAAIELYAPAPAAAPAPTTPVPSDDHQQPTETPNAPPSETTDSVTPTENEIEPDQTAEFPSEDDHITPTDGHGDDPVNSDDTLGDESPSETEPTSEHENSDPEMDNDDSNEDRHRRRLQRFLNYLFRRFRFSFWSPFSFLRW